MKPGTSKRRWIFVAAAIAVALVVPLLALLGTDVLLHSRFQRTGGVNVWGYRGPILHGKRAGERRIAVLGGSSAFGYGVAWNEALPARLEADLNASGDGRYSVVNLAYNNEGAYSFRFTLEDYLYLDYDVAILYEGYNDLRADPKVPNFSVFRHESPVFRLTGYLPILPVVFREKAAAVLYHGDISRMYDEMRNGQRVVFNASLADRTKAGALNATAAVGQALERQLGHLSSEPRPSISDPGGTGCQYPWAEYCRSVMDAVEFAEGHGKSVLVVTQPYLFGDTRDRHMDQQRELAGMLQRRFGNDRRVRYVNLGELVDLADPRLSFDRMHLTAAGNMPVAAALVEPVLQMAALKQAASHAR